MGRPARRYSQAARVQLLRETLEANQQVSVEQAVARLGVSRRTLYRDLAALQESGLALDSETADDGTVRWCLHPSARGRTFTLTTAQLVALFFGRAAFRFIEGTILHEQLEEIFTRLRAGLRQKDFDLLADLDRKLYVVGEAAKDYRRKDAVLDDVLTGLLLNRCVRFRSKPPAGPPRTHVVEPYTLLLHRAERRWHPSQRLLRLPGGRLRLTLRVSPTHEVAACVLGFGAGAEVLRPASLRARVAAELRAGAAQYRR